MGKTAIFLFGSQGSGKSTQGKFLTKELGYFDWNMGAMLRREAGSGSELGDRIKGLIEHGHLLDDNDLFAVLSSQLESVAAAPGAVFDGVPRRTNQAVRLMELLKQRGYDRFITVYINVPRMIAIERLMKRAEIEHRADDTPETINFRLKLFMDETWPMLEYLKTETTLLDIDGAPDIETVHASIKDHLSKIL